MAIQTPGAKSIQSREGNVTASSLSHVEGGLTVCWSATYLATPRATPSMPSVAMKGTTRRVVMARPLTIPTMPPATIPADNAAIGIHPSRSASAVTTLVRAMTAPTERSIPPLTMIMVIPMAPMATMTVCARTTRRFAPER